MKISEFPSVPNQHEKTLKNTIKDIYPRYNFFVIAKKQIFSKRRKRPDYNRQEQFRLLSQAYNNFKDETKESIKAYARLEYFYPIQLFWKRNAYKIRYIDYILESPRVFETKTLMCKINTHPQETYFEIATKKKIVWNNYSCFGITFFRTHNQTNIKLKLEIHDPEDNLIDENEKDFSLLTGDHCLQIANTNLLHNTYPTLKLIFYTPLQDLILYSICLMANLFYYNKNPSLFDGLEEYEIISNFGYTAEVGYFPD